METVFRQVLGASPTVRIIDYFLDNREFSHALADLVREEGMAFQTAKPVWDGLVRAKVLRGAGKRGKARLYRLDEKHPLVERFLALDTALVESGIVADG